jgi:flagellar basal body-associated protein FliL
MKNQKGSAALWITVILLIVILAGAAYWYWSQILAQSATSTTTQIPSAQQNGQIEPGYVPIW